MTMTRQSLCRVAVLAEILLVPVSCRISASAPVRPDGSVPALDTPADGRAPQSDRADGNPAPGSEGGVPPMATPPAVLAPGSQVDLVVPSARVEALSLVSAQLDVDVPTTAEAFSERWKPTSATVLGYDPLLAMQVDRLQASALKLNEGELALFKNNGFVISGRQAFPSFFYGYKSIYANDLPLFISADSILHAVHRSYDAILKEMERTSLIPKLEGLLRGMHEALRQGGGSELSASVRADADLYLTVARRLLERSSVEPVAGASASTIDMLVDKASRADGFSEVTLFGDPKRIVDFSQFKPRGHYAGNAQLEAYFRASIWLGRTDLRILVKQRFVRPQFELSLLLALLLDAQRMAAWESIDSTLRAWVGESDNMTVLDFGRLQSALGAASLAQVAQRSDQELAQAITDLGVGIQRIASQVLIVPPKGLNEPLDRIFLFFGQRFVLDSEVLSNVVFDRVLPEDVDLERRRMLPNPLDVAFAALGNTHAAPLLAAELKAYKNYPAALHRARKLVDGHEATFWNGNLYHSWLGALRAMSPPADLTTQRHGLPAVARTEAWSRRLLNTQLASWAELRHDTLLYAKQSYTTVYACEFPDAYVDPYPELWAALARYAQRGLALEQSLRPPGTTGGAMFGHFAELHTVAVRLEDMANRQITGQPFTSEQMAWVNEAVTIKEIPNCAGPLQVVDGWYVRLFYDREDSKAMDPTIADVHANPYDGEVLHAATGTPRLMVMTAETCQGPRAYVGLAASYHEKVTSNSRRFTDMEWSEELKTAPPPDVKWMQSIVSR